MRSVVEHGLQLDCIPVPAATAAAALALSRTIYAGLVEEEFSGDLVQTWAPAGIVDDRSWIPESALRALGLKASKSGAQLVASADCDFHTDAHGPTLLWVLHNEAVDLVFGRKRIRSPAPGEVIIFDDRQRHRASGTAKSGLFMAYNLPLVAEG